MSINQLCFAGLAVVIWVICFYLWLGVIYGLRGLPKNRKSHKSVLPKPNWIKEVHRQQEIDFRTGKRADGRDVK